jgi:hypothetical protein
LVKSKKHRRIPESISGIQINFCKNPRCANFGIPAPESRGAVPGGIGSYTLIGSTGRGRTLSCQLCKRTSVLRSNLAISQELARLNPSYYRYQNASCPNETCDSFGMSPAESPHLYYRHGATRKGEPRFRCKRCGNTFSCGAQIREQRKPELDGEVLKLLVNKVPMRRICEVLDINPATLYGKLGFLSEVMTSFSLAQERKLEEGVVTVKRAYISIDRQDYFLNWGTQFDRRNIWLGATAAANNETGYIFAAQLNFDSTVNAEDVEADAIVRGDYDLPPAYRHYARLCLRKDFESDSATDESSVKDGDVELSDLEVKAPHSGMQVHLEHTQYALIFRLKELLKNVEKIRLFVDRDPGLDSACIGVFAERVSARTADVFVVQTAKNMTMQSKKKLVSQVNRELINFKNSFPDIEEKKLRHQLVVHQLQARQAEANINPWFPYPLSDMADPNKSIQYQTDFGDYDIDHLARLYMKATLRGVDRFFMQIRRRISILERPLATANNANRRWHGYGAYSPLVVERALSIFKVYYNYCLVGEDGCTPAMRLGLTVKPVGIDEFCNR